MKNIKQINEKPKAGILYVFVRNDLASMNHGKAMAQVCHAGTKLVNDTINGKFNEKLSASINSWLNEADGFGTTLVFEASQNDINNIKKHISTLKHIKEHVVIDDIVDPTYPIKVPLEFLNLSELSDLNKDIEQGRVIFEESIPYKAFTKEQHTVSYIYVDADYQKIVKGVIDLLQINLHR